jgi:hypothetical protein
MDQSDRLKIVIDQARIARIPADANLIDYISLPREEKERLRPPQKFDTLMQIVFDSHVSYRTLDEGGVDFSKLTLEPLSQTKLENNLFEVLSSDYVKWFHHESCGVYDYMKLRHFFIGTGDRCVDILAHDPPIIMDANAIKST